MVRTVATALALIGLLAVAAPASAKQKTLYYNGKTEGGSPLSLQLKGKRISNISGYVPTVCVPSKGTPRTGSGSFDPPGSFRLGGTRKASRTRYVSWWGDTKFNYKVSVKKGRKVRKGRLWVAKLHVNYSYTQFTTLGGGAVDRTLYVCQGDDSFVFLV